MPNKPGRYCSKYPCPNLATPGGAYCEEHRPQEAKRTEPFYGTARWKRFRSSYLSKHPLCEMCGDVAEMVDHIKELRDGGAELSADNAQALCNRCHVRKTSIERKKRGKIVYSY